MTKSEHELFETWFQDYKLMLADAIKPALDPLNRQKATYLLVRAIDKLESNIAVSLVNLFDGMYFFTHLLNRLLEDIKNNTIALNMNLEM
ncbi:hypothetical protein CHL67_11310 [Prosthecochloris sp. GSB1]|uniref:hypothetical protein n=1 Tax=Prosthecochloris sp. GSB1 TaxID=281093 RepID=UPI000B8CD040|nr:hypothetical protein [Prosthecochloris sp. GSB1]ASQ91431.1 hypothetical protein CHL67_11310 [Prosthecochloris sp. GSB1]